ncbi:peptidylprolyl isomerase [Rossellomorea vietnamensis]|uniref:Peptidylprolyl isomerase n=2 Tax=Rossellomorea TaxID=2837508 RepID=A0A5D4KJA6_9BACI|nr:MULTISPECIES: SurA N-terminal domain-containing protein [Rossellomorea]TYR77374.1 peptidylprolyl isomerase [Rossellomorea vietnamensis]TYS82321.1 peptidylprolyl isomerase [Rossellomorea aquimaris]
MKNRWKLAMLTGILSLGLAACSDNEENAEEAENNSDVTEEQPAEQTEEQADQAAQMEEMQKKLEEQHIEEDKTVAVVNDEEIKGEAYNSLLTESQMSYQQMGQDPTSEEIAAQLKESTIDSLIGQTLLLQQAEEKGYEADDEEIQQEIATLKEGYEDEAEFEEVLKSSGLSLEDLEAEVAKNIKYTAYIENELTVEEVKEEDVKAYYDQIVEQNSGSEEAEAQIPEYEEVKDRIRQDLEGQKTQEVLAAEVEKLRENASIDVKI